MKDLVYVLRLGLQDLTKNNPQSRKILILIVLSLGFLIFAIFPQVGLFGIKIELVRLFFIGLMLSTYGLIYKILRDPIGKIYGHLFFLGGLGLAVSVIFDVIV